MRKSRLAKKTIKDMAFKLKSSAKSGSNISLNSKHGFASGSPDENNAINYINTPTGEIDMTNTPHKIRAIDEFGYEKTLEPFSGVHMFAGKRVKEIKL